MNATYLPSNAAIRHNFELKTRTKKLFGSLPFLPLLFGCFSRAILSQRCIKSNLAALLELLAMLPASDN